MNEEAVGVARPADQRAAWSLIAGLIAVFGLFPVIQLPSAVAGLALGVAGLKSTKRGLAIGGIALSAVALVVLIWLGASLYNAVQHVGVDEFLRQFLAD